MLLCVVGHPEVAPYKVVTTCPGSECWENTNILGVTTQKGGSLKPRMITGVAYGGVRQAAELAA
jgi:hypothetical protein